LSFSFFFKIGIFYIKPVPPLILGGKIAYWEIAGIITGALAVITLLLLILILPYYYHIIEKIYFKNK